MTRLSSLLIAVMLAFAASGMAAVNVMVTKLGAQSLGTSSELADDTLELLAEIRQKTGLGFAGQISLVLCTDQASFSGYLSSMPGGHYEVLGIYANPEIAGGVHVIALNLDLIARVRARARGVYKHELCHAVMYHNILGRLRPLWFEEGVCQWVSETPFEAAGRQAGYAGGRGPDPTSLNQVSAMMRDTWSMGEGYAHGLAAVATIVNRFGEDGLRELLAEMKRESEGGSSARFEEVFGRVFEASFGKFQEDFVESRRRTTWGAIFGFVGANMFPLSMLVAGILMLLAVERRKRKDRAIMAGWEVADRETPPDPEWSFGMQPRELPQPGPDGEELLVDGGETEFVDPIEEAMEEHDRLHGQDEDWWRKGKSEGG